MDLSLITNPPPTATTKRGHSRSPGPDAKRLRSVADPNVDPGGCASDTDAGSPPPPQVVLGPIKTRYRVLCSSTDEFNPGSEEVVGTYSCRRYANAVARTYLLREYEREDFDDEYTETEGDDGLVAVRAAGMEGATWDISVVKVKVRRMVVEVDVDKISNGGRGVAAIKREEDDDDEDEDEDENEEDEEDEEV
ncbi:hypothetical protein EDC01DRAFT_380856 [Geopyxis carbonaria]|nr:hypothetical protein EDC01DRAFT_380856 [Geopyxis carbonaria]